MVCESAPTEGDTPVPTRALGDGFGKIGLAEAPLLNWPSLISEGFRVKPGNLPLGVATGTSISS